VALGRALFSQKETPRLVILMRSKDNQEEVPAGVLTGVEQFKSRKNTHAKRKRTNNQGT